MNIFTDNFIYRITINTDTKEKRIITVVAENNCEDAVLIYAYDRFFNFQPELSEYTVEKLWELGVYTEILTIASKALEYNTKYPN